MIEGELPRPGVEFTALLPYERGDLVNRIHQQGEIASMEHTGEGTLVSGRANEDLSAQSAGLWPPSRRSLPGRGRRAAQGRAAATKSPKAACPAGVRWRRSARYGSSRCEVRT